MSDNKYGFEWWKVEFADRPELHRIYEDFTVFLHLVWQHLNLPPPTEIQLDMARYLQHGGKRRIIQGFRGVGKSYITSAFVCWLLLRDCDWAVMVVSASKQRADDFSTFTKRLIREMPILKHLVAQEKQRDSNVAFDVGPARAKHSPSVKSVGVTGQLTGSRANDIIADDIEVPGNAETQGQRDKTSELVKEFDSVIVPGGRVTYLGTPQTEQSLYNRLQERGYETRIWPSEVTDESYLTRMLFKVAPYLARKIEQGFLKFGKSTDPTRFSDADLAERRLSYGNSGYSLQFLLDTSLSDADRYPLKFRDLIVMPLDASKGPSSVVWGPKVTTAYNDLFTPGLDGDAFYGPAFSDPIYQPYTGSVMVVDPSGRGKDETAWAITKMLNATVYLMKSVGVQGGYEDHVLRQIANDAKTFSVNTIIVEDNFGQGMFASLLMPHLKAVGHLCTVETERVTQQKELRIIAALEPIMNQHRLVVSDQVIRDDDAQVSGYTVDTAVNYRLFYQMSRITKDRGALAHDDRLDAVAGAVQYWIDSLAQDAAGASEKAKDKDWKRDVKTHIQNQIDAIVAPHRARRKARKDGFMLNIGR
jgi:hypothetical protein